MLCYYRYGLEAEHAQQPPEADGVRVEEDPPLDMI